MIHRLSLIAPFPLSCAILLSLTGCGSPGGFPSLAPRPIEAVARQPERNATPPTRAVDPTLDTAVAALGRQLQDDATAWTAGLATTRAAVAAARGARVGDESWVVAQQAVSRLESIRQDTAAHLDGVAQLRLAQAQSATPADATRLDALWTRGVAQVADQNAAFADVAGALPAG